MDDYGYDRRPRWPLIGGAVLVALALLVVGFGFGRVSAPSSSSRPAQGATSAAQAPVGPGPARTVNGVPVGYAHTQAGAVAAATNFLMVMDGPLVTQPDRYRSAVDTLADPSSTSTLRRTADANLDVSRVFAASAASGRTVVHRSVPLAYHVDVYGSDRAQISVWEEALIAIDGALSLRETWSTTAMVVRWAGGDWRLASVSAPTTGSVGPAPTITQPAEQDTALPPQLAGYRSYRTDV